VVLKPGQEHIRHALDTVKAPYTVLPSPPDPDAYPRVRIHITSWVPFLISEHFYSEGDETRRAEFTAHYLGLCGMALSVGDSFDIPSLPHRILYHLYRRREGEWESRMGCSIRAAGVVLF
jgi:hypothetical protein